MSPFQTPLCETALRPLRPLREEGERVIGGRREEGLKESSSEGALSYIGDPGGAQRGSGTS